MIVVKIELWKFGNPDAVEELGRMYIANDGQGDREVGHYDVAVCRKAKKFPVPMTLDPSGPSPARTGRVENYPRLAYNVWRLISRALRSAFPEEK